MIMFLMRSRLLQGVAVVAIWLMMSVEWGKIQYRNGKADLLDRIEEARRDATEQRKVINEEIRNLDADDLVNRASEWVR